MAVFVVLYLLLIMLYVGMYSLMCAVLIFSYVVQAISLYAIAKRREIDNPWLAWIPVANSWLLGSVSDQYRYCLTGEDRKFRKRLLIQRIICCAIGPVVSSLSVVMYIAVLVAALLENVALVSVIGIMFMVLLFLLLVASILTMVFYYITQYKVLFDFYRSCNPKTSTLFFVLSFFSNIAMALGFLLNRNNDLGMPPKPEEIPDN